MPVLQQLSRIAYFLKKKPTYKPAFKTLTEEVLKGLEENHLLLDYLEYNKLTLDELIALTPCQVEVMSRYITCTLVIMGTLDAHEAIAHTTRRAEILTSEPVQDLINLHIITAEEAVTLNSTLDFISEDSLLLMKIQDGEISVEKAIAIHSDEPQLLKLFETGRYTSKALLDLYANIKMYPIFRELLLTKGISLTEFTLLIQTYATLTPEMQQTLALIVSDDRIIVQNAINLNNKLHHHQKELNLLPWFDKGAFKGHDLFLVRRLLKKQPAFQRAFENGKNWLPELEQFVRQYKQLSPKWASRLMTMVDAGQVTFKGAINLDKRLKKCKDEPHLLRMYAQGAMTIEELFEAYRCIKKIPELRTLFVNGQISLEHLTELTSLYHQLSLKQVIWSCIKETPSLHFALVNWACSDPRNFTQHAFVRRVFAEMSPLIAEKRREIQGGLPLWYYEVLPSTRVTHRDRQFFQRFSISKGQATYNKMLMLPRHRGTFFTPGAPVDASSEKEITPHTLDSSAP